MEQSLSRLVMRCGSCRHSETTEIWSKKKKLGQAIVELHMRCRRTDPLTGVEGRAARFLFCSLKCSQWARAPPPADHTPVDLPFLQSAPLPLKQTLSYLTPCFLLIPCDSYPSAPPEAASTATVCVGIVITGNKDEISLCSEETQIKREEGRAYF